MADFSISAPLREGNQKVLYVWYDGTDALLQGQGVCYHHDYNAPARPQATQIIAAETAASIDFGRTNRVVLPGYGPSGGTATTMYDKFAGVVADNHNASPTGQLIRIYTPGSTCYILAKFNATIGTGRLTCQADGTYAGYFTKAGFPGKGSALPLQTIDRSSIVGKIVAYLEDGPESGLVQDIPTTSIGGALNLTQGGITFFEAATNSTGASATLADGVPGARKMYVVVGTQTTNGITITLTNGIKKDGSTALNTLTSSTAGQCAILEWRYSKWQNLIASPAFTEAT